MPEEKNTKKVETIEIKDEDLDDVAGGAFDEPVDWKCKFCKQTTKILSADDVTKHYVTCLKSPYYRR